MKNTVSTFLPMKQNGERLTEITSYDYTTAKQMCIRDSSYGRKNPLPFSFSKRSPVSGLRRIRKQRATGVKRVETAGVCPLARRRGCGEPPSRPDGTRSISDSEQFDEDLYSCNNLHDKNLHFVQSISCHKRHDLIIYKVYCCFACQMTKQHN